MSLVDTILNGSKKESDAARKALHGNLIELLPFFSHKPYFNSESMTLVDVCIAPILWRLGLLGISLDQKANPITLLMQTDFLKKKVFMKVLPLQKRILTND